MAIVGIYIFIFILEFIFPYKKLHLFRKGFWIDAIWYSFLQGIVLQVLVFKFIDTYYRQHWMHTLSGYSTLVQVVIMLFALDFIDYWMHRLSHVWLPMWRTHEVHHSTLELNFLSGNRQHFTELLMSRTIIGALLAFSGISEQSMYWFTIIDAGLGLFNHSNIYINYGPLHYILNGPRMHQVHHLNKKEYQFRNFANKFSMWDWIFGTAYLPDRAEIKDIPYGIGYDYPDHLPGQLLYMFRREKKESFDKPNELAVNNDAI